MKPSGALPKQSLSSGWLRRTARAFGFLAALTGCSTLKADVTIRAQPERVWEGKLAPGQKLELVMSPVGKSPQSFAPKVIAVEPQHKLVWKGRLVMPLLFDGTHTFSIEVLDAEQVRFVQTEDFSGVLVPFVGFEPYRLGWVRMNQVLKCRAEAAELSARAAAQR